MNKNTTPLIILAAVIVLGGAALWYSMRAAPQAAPEVAPVPALSTSTDSAAAPAAPDGLPAVPPGLPAGTEVTGRTVWQGRTGDDWKIAFSAETTWKYSGTATSDGKHLSQATGGDDTTTYFVSRNIRIAEPSGLSFSAKQLTVAGVNVTAHIYAAPKPGSAFYEFFSLPVAGDTYYFRIESAVPSTKVADDFVSLIVIK